MKKQLKNQKRKNLLITSGLIPLILCPSAIAGTTAVEAEQSSSETSIDWLSIKSESRLRYETLDGQFRKGRTGSDQLLASRILVQIAAQFQPFTVNLEIQDSRAWLDDSGTPLSTSFVNTFEPINANVDLHLGKIFGSDSQTSVKIGRQTTHLGSGRFIERNGYRNTINTYDGVRLTTKWDNGNQVEAFYIAPTRAQPRDFSSLSNNEQELDKTDDAVRFWGGLITDRQNLIKGTTTELFGYGLTEKDTTNRNTANRDIYTIGFRTIKKSAPDQWDYEVEYAYQFGERRETTATSDITDLPVKAQMLHAEVGYQFDHPWKPRLAFEYDFASGDDNPDDNRYGSYDRLFGNRRGDVGFTSIHGPLVRNNLVLPGIDFEFKPNSRTDGFISYQYAALESNTDEFDVANLRDVTGNSGKFIGHTIDTRVRHWLIDDRLRWDTGGSILIHGDFLERVPDGPSQDRTLYGFTQLVARF